MKTIDNIKIWAHPGKLVDLDSHSFAGDKNRVMCVHYNCTIDGVKSKKYYVFKVLDGKTDAEIKQQISDNINL